MQRQPYYGCHRYGHSTLDSDVCLAGAAAASAAAAAAGRNSAAAAAAAAGEATTQSLKL